MQRANSTGKGAFLSDDHAHLSGVQDFNIFSQCWLRHANSLVHKGVDFYV